MEKRIQIGVKLPPPLVERVDRLRASMEYPPDRTEVIERALLEWCERVEKARKRR